MHTLAADTLRMVSTVPAGTIIYIYINTSIQVELYAGRGPLHADRLSVPIALTDASGAPLWS